MKPQLKDLIQISDFIFEVPKTFWEEMKVPARVFANKEILNEILKDRSLEQLVNVATLPGIKKYALAMPDIHEGYGFPIGGVAAFDIKEGIISPGGIGYDINCGVRLLLSQVSKEEASPYLQELAKSIYENVPSGVGKGGKLNLKIKDLDLVLEKGVPQMLLWGFGENEDLANIESQGNIKEADPQYVSSSAKSRGKDQLGTMGAGNHFVEIDFVEKIFDEKEAKRMSLFLNQIVILIHTGSRGLGHQVATDYIEKMVKSLNKYKIKLPDLELAASPFLSEEGQNYFQAMCAAANFAWSNRQLITHQIRKSWKKVLGKEGGKLKILYDVAHNIAKIEEYEINGEKGKEKKKLIVHRKGATRSFPNDPVLIPGSMGTFSYVLVGNKNSLEESFGSTCHGAGRRMSRQKAKKTIYGSELKKQLEKENIIVKEGSLSGLAEEAPFAYKDVNEVVEVVSQNKIASKVARLKPLAVIKG
jgi:tRNA-splicing ligase RtcB